MPHTPEHTEESPVRSAAPVSMVPDAPAAVPAPKLPAQNVISAGSVDARTKALLEAVATGGKRGLESFQQAEKNITESRKQALGRASALAGLIGGPESQGFEKIADQQFGNRLTDLDQSRTAFTEDMARRGMAGRTAVDAFGKISPLIRAQVEKDIAKKRAATIGSAQDKISKDFEARALGQATIDEETASKNLQTLDKDIQRLESERTKLASDATKREGRVGAIDKRLDQLTKEWRMADQGTNIGKLLHGGRLLDKPRPKKDIEREQDALRVERHQLLKGQSTGLKEWDARNAKTLENLKAEREKFAGITAETRADRARGIATEQLGVDPALAAGKITPTDTKAAVQALVPADDKKLISSAGLADQKQLDSLRKTDVYKEFVEALPILTQTQTKEGILQTLREQAVVDGAFNAPLYNLLVTQFGGMFPTSASLRSQERGTS